MRTKKYSILLFALFAGIMFSVMGVYALITNYINFSSKLNPNLNCSIELQVGSNAGTWYKYFDNSPDSSFSGPSGVTVGLSKDTVTISGLTGITSATKVYVRIHNYSASPITAKVNNANNAVIKSYDFSTTPATEKTTPFELTAVDANTTNDDATFYIIINANYSNQTVAIPFNLVLIEE